MGAEIEITVSPAGETVVKVIGCSGPSCTELTKAIERALGRVAEDRKTEDYYRRQGGGHVAQR